MKPLIIITWLLLGAFYWWIHDSARINCCQAGESTHTVVTDAEVEEEARTPMPPIAFEYSSSDPLLSEDFDSYRDSVIELAGEDEILVITGLYGRNEGSQDLGMARASAMSDLLDSRLDEENIELRSERAGVLDTNKAWFELIRFETAPIPEKVVEIEDRTLIYFNFNSTKRIEEPEIEAYLSDVAERVNESGETVYLTGHTDSYGNASYNYNLGLWRAGKIRDVLLRFGVPDDQIVVDSKGEISPIAPNNTKEGRSKNRRTELVIQQP